LGLGDTNVNITIKERIREFEETLVLMGKTEKKIKGIIEEEKQKLFKSQHMSDIIKSLVSIIQLELAIENINLALEDGDFLYTKEDLESISIDEDVFVFLDESYLDTLSNDCETLKILLRSLKNPVLKKLLI
jgi:hypothetical protein